VRGGALGVTHLTFLSLERLELNAAIPRFGPELANSQVGDGKRSNQDRTGVNRCR